MVAGLEIDSRTLVSAHRITVHLVIGRASGLETDVTFNAWQGSVGSLGVKVRVIIHLSVSEVSLGHLAS
jgi:hypothetical protein